MIYMFCPDFTPKSGGTKRVYHVTKILNDNGYEACVMHMRPGFRLTWMNIMVPIVNLKETEFKEDDLIVIPEGCIAVMKQVKDEPCRKIAFAMSIEYIMNNLSFNQTWKDFNINKAICTTEGLCSYISDIMNIDCYNVSFSIDFDMFKYNEKEKEEGLVVFPGRPDSNIAEAQVINKILRLKHESFKKWHFIPLSNYGLEDYGKMVRKAQYYLTFAKRWGCNSPAVEAQAAGCVVLGYNGVHNTVIHNIDVYDVHDCNLSMYGDYQGVAENIFYYETIKRIKREVINNAIENASQYTFENEKELILKAFGEIV